MDKEKCVNKKLHPYWKTGIYGWLGEEVDDNDYMCCPICGEILAMNYWDYSAEHDGDNKCPRCGQELDYGEIYDFEDTLYFRQLLEIKDDKLADLESKLAECEQEKLLNSYGMDRNADIAEDYKKQKADLEAKLAESEEKLKYLKEEVDANFVDGKDYDQLKQQLEESENEIERLKSKEKKIRLHTKRDWFERCCRLEDKSISLGLENIDLKHSQNQTAIAELEKVIKFMKTRDKCGFFPEQMSIAEYINQQIKSLKGEKENV